MNHRKFFFIAIPLLLLIAEENWAFQIRGLKSPESIIVDPQTGIYYVANRDGGSNIRDNRASISKIGSDGLTINRHFIKAGRNGIFLHAPKGLAILGEELFVTDLDRLQRFDKESGRYLGAVDLSALGVKSLHGITQDGEGNIYVSDTLGNAIYKIAISRNYEISRVFVGPKLGQPKGLAFEEKFKRLIVAAPREGKLLAIQSNGTCLTLFQDRQLRYPDGVDIDRMGHLIVSSSREGVVYHLKNYSTLEKLRDHIVTPASVSFDFKNNQVLVSSLKGNIVFTLPLD